MNPAMIQLLLALVDKGIFVYKEVQKMADDIGGASVLAAIDAEYDRRIEARKLEAGLQP